MIIIFTGVMVPGLQYLIIGWSIPPSDSIHHLHEFLASIFFWSLLVGAGAQFIKPHTKAAPVLQIVGATAVMAIILLLTNTFFPPPFIFLLLALFIFALHPVGWRQLLRREGKPHWLLLGLTLLAIYPAISYAHQTHLATRVTH